jgi:hypothetical protein
MNHQAGVWIDHRQAVIVALAPSGERLTRILSNVEKHPERSGDSPMKGDYEAAQVPADDKRQRALTGDLARYYDAVAAALHGAASVILFGPGEAKTELHRRMTTQKSPVHVAAVQTEDKMTDAQIAAKVRVHFNAPG